MKLEVEKKYCTNINIFIFELYFDFKNKFFAIVV